MHFDWPPIVAWVHAAWATGVAGDALTPGPPANAIAIVAAATDVGRDHLNRNMAPPIQIA
jgi:hypothetical protein